MNAYHVQDRIEAKNWTKHYQQIAREEKVADLANDLEKGLKLRHFEGICVDELQRCGAGKKAISKAFDDDVEFQERMAAHARYMAEVIAKHQIDFEESE